MALNFGLLGDVGAPAMGYLQGQQDVARNQLAQQQIETGRMTQDKMRMEMDAMKRRQAGLDQFMQKAKELGVDGDPEQLTQVFYEHAISTGDMQQVQAAQIARQAAKERKEYMASQPGAGGAVATPVPMTNNLGTALPAAGAPAQVNAIAPAVAAPPQGNALGGNRLSQIENRLLELRRFPTAGAQERADLINERDRLMTPHVVGNNLVTLGSGVSYTAPSAPLAESTLAKLRREMAALPPGDPGRAEYASMIRKEINFAPTNVGQGKPPAGYRYDSSGENLEVIPGGPADKQEKLKPIPPQINTAIITNQQSIKKLEDGLKLLKDYPDAVGIKGGLPQSIVNRVDEKGIPVRAAIADIGSLVLHDRSGAAVTASEEPRLLPFIPTPSDTAKSAKEKLERMLRYAKEQQDALKGTYSEDQGYRTNPILNPGNPTTPVGGSAITAADAILARINQGRR